jgi:hypothetical protein
VRDATSFQATVSELLKERAGAAPDIVERLVESAVPAPSFPKPSAPPPGSPLFVAGGNLSPEMARMLNEGWSPAALMPSHPYLPGDSDFKMGFGVDGTLSGYQQRMIDAGIMRQSGPGQTQSVNSTGPGATPATREAPGSAATGSAASEAPLPRPAIQSDAPRAPLPAGIVPGTHSVRGDAAYEAGTVMPAWGVAADYSQHPELAGGWFSPSINGRLAAAYLPSLPPGASVQWRSDGQGPLNYKYLSPEETARAMGLAFGALDGTFGLDASEGLRNPAAEE